jgi:hypothetical protein
MTGIETVACFAFHPADGGCNQSRVNFHLCTTRTANDVMVGLSGEFICQVTITPVRYQQDAVPGQKFQGTVDGGLGHAGLVDACKYLRRGEMPAIVQGLKDSETLGGHAVTA